MKKVDSKGKGVKKAKEKVISKSKKEVSSRLRTPKRAEGRSASPTIKKKDYSYKKDYDTKKVYNSKSFSSKLDERKRISPPRKTSVERRETSYPRTSAFEDRRSGYEKRPFEPREPIDKRYRSPARFEDDRKRNTSLDRRVQTKDWGDRGWQDDYNRPAPSDWKSRPFRKDGADWQASSFQRDYPDDWRRGQRGRDRFRNRRGQPFDQRARRPIRGSYEDEPRFGADADFEVTCDNEAAKQIEREIEETLKVCF